MEKLKEFPSISIIVRGKVKTDFLHQKNRKYGHSFTIIQEKNTLKKYSGGFHYGILWRILSNNEYLCIAKL